jgi:hypothetical protein
VDWDGVAEDGDEDEDVCEEEDTDVEGWAGSLLGAAFGCLACRLMHGVGTGQGFPPLPLMPELLQA